MVLILIIGCEIKFDRIESHDFKTGPAIIAFDKIPFFNILIYVNLDVTFRAGCHWHCSIPPNKDFYSISIAGIAKRVLFCLLPTARKSAFEFTIIASGLNLN